MKLKIANKKDTPWKTNMSPENQWLGDVFPIEIVPFFRGHVSLSGMYWKPVEGGGLGQEDFLG